MGCGPCVRQRLVKTSVRYLGPLLADESLLVCVVDQQLPGDAVCCTGDLVVTYHGPVPYVGCCYAARLRRRA